jgi:hypothetical protein
MNDMHSNTLSKDSGVSNDITSGTTIGSIVGVKRDVINPSGGMDDSKVKKIPNLFIRNGSGKINLPK